MTEAFIVQCMEVQRGVARTKDEIKIGNGAVDHANNVIKRVRNP